MTFSQYIRSMAVDELLAISELVNQEIERRNTFLDDLASIQLKGIGLTINTRDLLYRVLNNRQNEPMVNKQGDLSIKDLFCLLKKEDWLYIEYINARSFLEIRNVLLRYNASLEEYYGSFDRKSNKSLNHRLVKALEIGLYKR